MDVRSALFGSRRRLVVVALVVVLVAGGAAVAFGVLGAPSVTAVENRFGEVDQERTTIHTDLVVNNPNPVGVQLGDTRINYTVAMNDVSIANGSKRGLEVDPGNTTLEFTTRMRNEKIPAWWVTHVRNGERTEVQIDAQARTGLLGGRVGIGLVVARYPADAAAGGLRIARDGEDAHRHVVPLRPGLLADQAATA
jgi:LEA14-like dessication related protein